MMSVFVTCCGTKKSANFFDWQNGGMDMSSLATTPRDNSTHMRLECAVTNHWILLLQVSCNLFHTFAPGSHNVHLSICPNEYSQWRFRVSTAHAQKNTYMPKPKEDLVWVSYMPERTHRVAHRKFSVSILKRPHEHLTTIYAICTHTMYIYTPRW